MNGVQKVVSYVKMRERGSPSPEISVAAAPPSDQQGQPVPVDTNPKRHPHRPSPPKRLRPSSRRLPSRPRAASTPTPMLPAPHPPPGANNNSINLLQSSPDPAGPRN